MLCLLPPENVYFKKESMHISDENSFGRYTSVIRGRVSSQKLATELDAVVRNARRQYEPERFARCLRVFGVRSQNVFE